MTKKRIPVTELPTVRPKAPRAANAPKPARPTLVDAGARREVRVPDGLQKELRCEEVYTPAEWRGMTALVIGRGRDGDPGLYARMKAVGPPPTAAEIIAGETMAAATRKLGGAAKRWPQLGEHVGKR